MSDARTKLDETLSDAETTMEAGILAEIGSRVHVRSGGWKLDAILSAYDGDKLGLRDAEHGYIVWLASGVVLKTAIEKQPEQDDEPTL